MKSDEMSPIDAFVGGGFFGCHLSVVDETTIEEGKHLVTFRVATDKIRAKLVDITVRDIEVVGVSAFKQGDFVSAKISVISKTRPNTSLRYRIVALDPSIVGRMARRSSRVEERNG